MHTTACLQTWFERRLGSVFERRRITVAQATHSYLAALLTTFAGTPRLTDGACGRSAHRPLADCYFEAAGAASPCTRREALRRCGDLALFVCGVFPGFVTTRLVGQDYYRAMGRSAYAELAQEMPSGCMVFASLASAFGRFADALSETVWGESAATDPLALYERWLTEGGGYARERLAALGLTPSPAACADVTH